MRSNASSPRKASPTPQRSRATSTRGTTPPIAHRMASRSNCGRATFTITISRMTIATIGAAKITRIEESYEPNFEARTFFPDWRDEIVAPHMHWLAPNHYDPASGRLKLSIHSWLIEIGGGGEILHTPPPKQKNSPQPR